MLLVFFDRLVSLPKEIILFAYPFSMVCTLLSILKIEENSLTILSNAIKVCQGASVVIIGIFSLFCWFYSACKGGLQLGSSHFSTSTVLLFELLCWSMSIACVQKWKGVPLTVD